VSQSWAVLCPLLERPIGATGIRNKPDSPEHGALLSLWLPVKTTLQALEEELVAGPPRTGHNDGRPMRLRCRREHGATLVNNYN
jgi:hypothetical protein